jgi:hypothetical protein
MSPVHAPAAKAIASGTPSPEVEHAARSIDSPTPIVVRRPNVDLLRIAHSSKRMLRSHVGRNGSSIER